VSYESALRAYVAAHAPTRAGQRSATDALIATAGLDRLGAALLRLRLVGDAHEYGPTLRHLQPAVRRELAIRGLATSGEAARRAASRALRAWLAGPCQACQGRRYEQIPGAPSLSDRPCQGCAGTGSRISDFMQGSDRDQLACALILIEHRYGHAIGALRARLYGPKITTRENRDERRKGRRDADDDDRRPGRDLGSNGTDDGSGGQRERGEPAR